MRKNILFHVVKVVNQAYCLTLSTDFVHPKLYYSTKAYDKNPQYLQDFSGNQLWVQSPKRDRRIYFCVQSDNFSPQWAASTHVEIDSIPNFRDMGGYETQNGKTVKWGQFFRSGTLTPLEGDEKEVLESLNLKHILDYRSEGERNQSPDNLPSTAQYYPVPAMKESSNIAKLAATDFKTIMGAIKTKEDGQKAIDLFLDLYSQLPFENPAYQTLFEAMDDVEENPILQHCSAGKDRTGVGCALVLLALGVDEETVMEDYLLSNVFRNTFFEIHKMEKLVGASFSEEALHVATFLSQVSKELLSASFIKIKEHYTTFDHFFLKEYGISQEKLVQWQQKYTL